MSDLHLECYEDDVCVDKFITPSADILVLAGDIGRIHKYKQLENFLLALCKKFKIVLYVLGNHEYYMVDGVEAKSMDALLTDLNKIKEQIDNLYVLNRNSIIVDNVCFVGCTLWTQPDVEVPRFIVKIKDITTKQYSSLHCHDLQYIKYMVDYCQTKNIKLVVISHHCPSLMLLGTSRQNFRYKSLYASELDYLLTSKKIHTWVFGHNHRNFDFIARNGTHLVSNQKGKPKDGIQDFSLTKTVSIDME